MKQNKKGFTLIEILVVVLIIGILAAIALPQYKMVVAKTKFGTLKTNAKVLADAAERYYLIHNTYPSNYDDLDVEIQGAQLTRSSVNDFDISLPDGSICSIWFTSAPAASCRKENILGDTVVYYQFFTQNNNSPYKACLVFSGDTTSMAHRLCQQESGKTGDQASCSGSKYCYYYY